MKIFAISTFLALGSIAQAATIFVDCSSASVSGQPPIPGGTVSSTVCPTLVTPVGQTANSVTLFYKYDASFAIGAGSVTMSHDVITAALNFFDDPTLRPVTDTVRPFNGSLTTNVGLAPILAALALGNNVITGTYGSSSGSVTNVAFDYRWQIDYSPSGQVPEPSTYAMMAAGLMSFYALRRKS